MMTLGTVRTSITFSGQRTLSEKHQSLARARTALGLRSLGALLVSLCAATASAAGTWTVTTNGQSVTINGDGQANSIKIFANGFTGSLEISSTDTTIIGPTNVPCLDAQISIDAGSGPDLIQIFGSGILCPMSSVTIAGGKGQDEVLLSKIDVGIVDIGVGKAEDKVLLEEVDATIVDIRTLKGADLVILSDCDLENLFMETGEHKDCVIVNNCDFNGFTVDIRTNEDNDRVCFLNNDFCAGVLLKMGGGLNDGLLTIGNSYCTPPDLNADFFSTDLTDTRFADCLDSLPSAD